MRLREALRDAMQCRYWRPRQESKAAPLLAFEAIAGIARARRLPPPQDVILARTAGAAAEVGSLAQR
jgi:hypothetical protein